MESNIDDNAFSNNNLFERCPPELLFYYVFPYLTLSDILTLRLVSKALQVLINSFATHSKKKALCLRISTQEQLDTLIKNPTEGTGLPYVLSVNKAMISMLTHSLLSNKDEAQEKKALLAKIAHIEISSDSIAINNDMLPINKIVQLGQDVSSYVRWTFLTVKISPMYRR